MAKKQIVPLCSRCEAPLRSASAFCPSCGGPTPWATHDERVAWEVRQWRASRAREQSQTSQMMLVRTEAGFEPAPMDPRTNYVWDQPLHPEREGAEAAPLRPQPARAYGGNGHGAAAAAVALEEPVEEFIAEEGLAPEEPVELQAPPSYTRATSIKPATSIAPPASFDRDEQVPISKKAVALAIVLALGLPLGSKVLGMSRGSGEEAGAPVAAQAVTGGAPAALTAVRSGFLPLSPDAVRYAIVIRNPNPAHAAQGVTVSVSLFDAAGRRVGADLERIGAVPPAGSVAVAGAAGVAGPVHHLEAKIGVDAYLGGATARPFVVRSVQMSRSGGSVVVRAAISGSRAASDARVVVVHLDRSGRIVGGDFTFLDVPRAPRSATAVISTSGLDDRAQRVEVYVLASR